MEGAAAPSHPPYAMTSTHPHLRTPLVWLAAAGLVLTALATPTSAQSPASAKRFLEQRHDRVNRTLQQGESAARNQQLAQLLGELLDYETLSQRSLGDHWESHSAQERAEFVSLLKQLIERSYKANLQRTLSYEVRYEDAQRRGDVVLVQTVARSRENRRAPPVTIDYELSRKGNAWKVVNVITDGQSLVQTYRNQFHRILEQDGWDGLIARMRQRLGS